MRIETIHPRELEAAQIARWRGHQSAQAGFASPYLTPEWAQLVGAARDDARVCVIDDGAGFLAVQRPSRFAAFGIGAPICDYQGVIGDTAVSAADLCRALKVGRIDLTHLPNPQAILSGGPAHSESSWIAETVGGRELYEASLRQKRSEFVRQTDKKLRRLQREKGPVQLAVSRDAADFETLLRWKNAQLRATGQPEIWAAPWVRRCLDASFASEATAFQGKLFTMRVGDTLAAANFCLRAGNVMHMWVLAHDDAFETASPGTQLTRWVLGWAGEHGVAEVDFGPGEYRYKRQFSTTQRSLYWGTAHGASISGAWRRAAYALRGHMEQLPHQGIAALPGKAMRRLDLMRALAA